ncbi:transmembrane channel-like protein 4 [Arapaima gigas]
MEMNGSPQNSAVGVQISNGSHESLSLRERPSAGVDQRVPQYNWNPSPAEVGGESSADKLQDLKTLPMRMALKKAIRQVRQMKVPVVSSLESWKKSKTKAAKRFLKVAGEAMAYAVPWRRTIHQIGGHFGGGVQSYFLFLQFLVVLNLLSSLLMAGFVLTPSIVFRSSSFVNSSDAQNVTGKTSSRIVTVIVEFLTSDVHLLVLRFLVDQQECTVYSHSPQGLIFFYQYFLDLLSGTGFMEYSYLFYGYYNNTMGVSMEFSYNIPLAYLLTAAFYLIFCLICIIIRMGAVVRIVVKTGGGAVGSYSRQAFTGWDFGLQGDRAVKLKQNNIRYQLQMDLEEERIKQHAASLTLAQTVGLYAKRVFLNLIVLGLIGLAFYAIFKAAQFSQTRSGGTFVDLLVEYLPSMVITAANFVVPFLCDQIALLERYSPSTTVILALLRAVFLRLASLVVLLFTLWSGITCSGDLENTDCSICKYNHKQYPCWETHIGQEMYKLAIFDFITVVVVMVLVEFPRRIIVDNCSCKLAQFVGRQEFVIPQNVLGLVYGQTVVWIGALFCPLLPFVNIIKFIIIFYCRKLTLFQNCRPAVRTFRSNSSKIFFLIVLLLGWILASLTLIYSAAKIHPSMGCGPFRSLLVMWDVVPQTLHTLSDSAKEFLFYIGSQAFAIPLFIFLCVLLCYIAALASVYGKTVSLLRTQLKMEGRDKQFLVKRIEELSSVRRRKTEGWNEYHEH